jgi:hypothetical protein
VGSTPASRNKKFIQGETKMEKEQEYIPFGDEWEKSVMRMSKATIVKMYRKVCIEKLQLEEKIEELKK